jgi:hypothetical protein
MLARGDFPDFGYGLLFSFLGARLFLSLRSLDELIQLAIVERF